MHGSPAETAALPPQQTGPDARTRDRPPAAPRPGTPWWIWALAGGLFLVYAALSLRTHQRFLSRSFDLGIFEQAVRSYATGRLPVSEIKGPDFPVLGDHFSPVIALLAPLYRIWPSASTLLLAQAALIAASVLPLARWAHRALGAPAAVVTGLCYGLSWGLASGVGYDFHEVAFAVPLLAASLAALGEGRMRAAACWALPLLLVKEDLGLTVAVIGLVIAWRCGPGARRTGILVALAGAAGALLVMTVVLPAFHPQGFDGYVASHGTEAAGGAAGGAGDSLYRMTVGLLTPETKVATLVLVLAPTLFLAVRSPLMWVAVPTLVWRLASDNPVHWGTGYHYSLVLMPVVFAAFVDALNRRGSSPAGLRRYLLGAAGVCLLLLPAYSWWQLVQPATWRADPRAAVAERLMDRIPDGAVVQASDNLVPHLTDRTSVSVYGWQDSRPGPQWIIVDTRVPVWRHWPLSVPAESIALARSRANGYASVAEQDGFVLLSRRP
ncbi:DUF2079 domain-containing protein [Streptomyces sp. NBC_00249]|uniref:DUF2079 domain-containing protein n=1 Tax=Streptomyces sp. NBC_00249 TaxID=2975690 RepID=UPI002250CC20|nr:DUF2079 domain-containing protein [Streptomyces sp. NBC_00249]MCX5194666.1 DUF2079 domain-containing protein [Streptomyces sp. NBC_00249]